MAIGLALMLGFMYPKNFDSPYKAESITEFWHRWHQSLSTWLRDYLYIPLGGNRKGRRRTYVNLLLTMLIGGLWHGANWTFVIWGALHGLGLVVVRLWQSTHGTAKTAGVWRYVNIFVTFNFVAFAWIFFRAPSLEIAGQIL